MDSAVFHALADAFSRGTERGGVSVESQVEIVRYQTTPERFEVLSKASNDQITVSIVAKEGESYFSKNLNYEVQVGKNRVAVEIRSQDREQLEGFWKRAKEIDENI